MNYQFDAKDPGVLGMVSGIGQQFPTVDPDFPHHVMLAAGNRGNRHGAMLLAALDQGGPPLCNSTSVVLQVGTGCSTLLI